MANKKISTKKLKAIVFTDIVDFTKMSAEDEQQALDIIDKQREMLKPIVIEHKGEWLKEIGDGLLFSFDSSLDAVQCSIQIQEALKDINDFKIRIGIHQGDIFIKDGDVYGDDVNIAARVEGFAPIGGVALSDKVKKDIQSVSKIKTDFIGHRKLKGVQQETKVSCITSHNLPTIKTSFLPKFSGYIAFMFAIGLGLLLLLTIAAQQIDLTTEFGQAIAPSVENLKLSLITYSPNETLFMLFTEVLVLFLLGHSCLAYYKGVSINSQKAIVYFTYFLLFTYFYEIAFEAITDTDSNPVHMAFVGFFLFILIPIVSIGIYKLFYKKYKSKMNL